MSRRHVRPALLLSAALLACTAVHDERQDAEPTHASADVADPMADFGRMVSGEWRVTFASGVSQFGTWHWGPGKHSICQRGLEVMYWHPGRKQVCLFSLHPDIPGIGRGVSEGTLEFDGETANGVFDLYQPGVRRKMGLRRTFDGPDKYHEILLEASGSEGLKPLAEWDFFRVPTRSHAQSRAAEDAPRLPEHLRVFEALVGGTWKSKSDSAAGNALRTEATFEFVPDYVYASVVAQSEDGASTHVLDAYVYQHVRTGELRCLALSDRGGVYEGVVTALEGGTLQLDLEGCEGDRVVPYVVRFDFEQDGTLHHRIWSLEGTERSLVLDAHHTRLEQEHD